MTYKKFEKFMKELIYLKNQESKISKAFQGLDSDFNYISFGRYESLIVNLLQETMNDIDDWISYWIYELDFGKEAKKNSVSLNGKHIPIKTIKDLYNILNSKK